jgi:hypothetical protein
MSENILIELMNEAHDSALLKRILADKLNRYGGITHSELALICTMFGIEKEVEEK